MTTDVQRLIKQRQWEAADLRNRLQDSALEQAELDRLNEQVAALSARVVEEETADCIVTPSEAGCFVVHGPCGRFFAVEPVGGQEARCSCNEPECCHVRAVRAFAETVLFPEPILRLVPQGVM